MYSQTFNNSIATLSFEVKGWNSFERAFLLTVDIYFHFSSFHFVHSVIGSACFQDCSTTERVVQLFFICYALVLLCLIVLVVSSYRFIVFIERYGIT